VKDLRGSKGIDSMRISEAIFFFLSFVLTYSAEEGFTK